MSRWHQHEWDLLPEHAFRGTPNNKFTRQPTREGGKGSNVPPPDPRLVEAQIKSMGIQDDAIQEIMGLSKRMQPLQEEQMRMGIDAAKQAQGESAADREWMLGRRDMLSGLQNQLVSDAKTFNTEQRQDELRAQAMGDVNQAFSNARDQGQRNLQRMGVDPNSGRSLALNNQMSATQALGLAQAASAANAQGRQEGYALTDRASNALAGYPAMGMQATGSAAGFGAAGLGLANQGLAGMNSGYGAAGSMAGQMGANATNMYGAQASYKTAADRAAADSDPFGALLGAGAKLGVAAIGKW